MTVDDGAPVAQVAQVAQVFPAREVGDAQALRNLVHPKRLLALEHLGDDGRALRFFR